MVGGKLNRCMIPGMRGLIVSMKTDIWKGVNKMIEYYLYSIRGKETISSFAIVKVREDRFRLVSRPFLTPVDRRTFGSVNNLVDHYRNIGEPGSSLETKGKYYV